MTTSLSLARQLAVHHAPQSRAALAAYLQLHMGLHLPLAPVCPHHQTPLDYLAYAFFEGRADGPLIGPTRGPDAPPADLVVWACRGGGKTQLAAAATLLDLLFKPGIQIRILGGSLEQSEKMYAYLRQLIARGFAKHLAGTATHKRLVFTNGSRVEVLAQSESAVRGQRVQRLRCDEVELFDPAIWQAAQLTTRSLERPMPGENGTTVPQIRASIEAISTFHIPGGLMDELIGPCAAASEIVAAPPALSPGMPHPARRVLAWCIWDVIARCGPERACADCPLHEDCQGRARRAEGFVPVADVLAMHARVARQTWESEMLCLRPKEQFAVFPRFDAARHISATPPNFSAGGMPSERWICGIDPGLRTFVCLWLQLFDARTPHFYVAREFVSHGRTLGQNIAALLEESHRLLDPARLEVVYCDAAGAQRNSHTGSSDVELLRQAGLPVRYAPQRIEQGLQQIDALLTPADPHAPAHLTIHPSCTRLLAAFQHYRRDSSGRPLKDDIHDHLIDALRYAITGVLGVGDKVSWRRY